MDKTDKKFFAVLVVMIAIWVVLVLYIAVEFDWVWLK